MFDEYGVPVKVCSARLQNKAVETIVYTLLMYWTLQNFLTASVPPLQIQSNLFQLYWRLQSEVMYKRGERCFLEQAESRFGVKDVNRGSGVYRVCNLASFGIPFSRLKSESDNNIDL